MPDRSSPSRPAPRDPSPARPLLVTADPGLLDDVVRLGAAAGVELTVHSGPGAARAAWAEAPAVLVGGDVAEDCVRAGLPRRGDVVLVGLDLDDARVWRRAVDLGASHVVFLPDAETWLVDLLADAAEGQLGAGHLVGVIGGRGGAGATTLATALAITSLRSGRRTMLVDADPLGGGIDLVLGGETADGLRWPDLAGSRGRVSGSALEAALPRVDELTVLSWDRGDETPVPPAAMQSLLGAAVRGSDLVVVDLPRRIDDAGRSALAGADTTLLVVPAELRACAAGTQRGV
jgi:secretion/DNA translocation related CpaE-like protein